MSAEVTFRLEIGKAALAAEKGAAAPADAPQWGEATPLPVAPAAGLATAHFVEPVSIVAVASIAWLAQRLVNHWLKSEEQGVQIDLRDKPPVVSRIRGVPTGFLVIINPDGTAQTQQAAYEKPSDLAPLLAELLGSN